MTQRHGHLTVTKNTVCRFYIIVAGVNRPLSLDGHVESQENKKLCFCTVSLALNSRLAKACRAKTKFFFPRDSTWPPSDKGLLAFTTVVYKLGPFFYMGMNKGTR